MEKLGFLARSEPAKRSSVSLSAPVSNEAFLNDASLRPALDEIDASDNFFGPAAQAQRELEELKSRRRDAAIDSVSVESAATTTDFGTVQLADGLIAPEHEAPAPAALRRARAVKLTRVGLACALLAAVSAFALHGRGADAPQTATVAASTEAALPRASASPSANPASAISTPAFAPAPVGSAQAAASATLSALRAAPVVTIAVQPLRADRGVGVLASPGPWLVKSVDDKGLIVQVREGILDIARRFAIGQSLPNGEVIQAVKPESRSYVTDHATIALAPASSAATGTVGTSPKSSDQSAAAAPSVNSRKLDKADKLSAANRVEKTPYPTRTARMPTPTTAARSQDKESGAEAALPQPKSTAGTATTQAAGRPHKDPATSPVSPAAIAQAKATNNIETVGADTAGITRVDSSGVMLKNGRKIGIGASFPSGERLLSVDPASQQIITDARTILVF